MKKKFQLTVFDKAFREHLKQYFDRAKEMGLIKNGKIVETPWSKRLKKMNEDWNKAFPPTRVMFVPEEKDEKAE